MHRLQTWLHRDHQALLQLMQWLAECDPERQESACLSVLRRVHRHTDAHLCIEDELLFPVLERKRKSDDVMLLRSAHGRLRHAIGKLNGACINADWPQFRCEAKQLLLEFQRLETFEQQRLGQLIDESLSAQEEAALWQACLAIRQRVGMPVSNGNEDPGSPLLQQAI